MRAGEHLWQQGQLSAPARCWRGGGSGWWGVVALLGTPRGPVPSAAGSASTSVLSALHRGFSCHQGQSAVTWVDAPAMSCPSPPTMRRHLEQPVSKQEMS